MPREKLDSLDPKKVAAVMSEGNFGALSVLIRLDILSIFHLDDMNLRGTRIWIAYKNGCGQDIDVLIKRVVARDPELVRLVNEFPGQSEEPQAVTGGASHE